jgi:REP element-mobilizing transposase RayT
VYRRRLPHIYHIGEPIFVTWRLAGSLTANRPFRDADLTSGQAFAVFDRLLDTARTGPLYLKQPALAGLVMGYLMRMAQCDEIYDLHAFALMPNHVHMLFTPNIPLAQIMKRVKGGTARLANQVLGATGRTFWQDESYDHFVRDRDEFLPIRRYIELNPVRAGLVAAPEEFPYSSASPGCGDCLRNSEAGLKSRAD